ncbi:hypothetical protein [Hwanghaeella sp.]|uniref:hypothetical protein n=1 Tax=Hwanghaeella sp. TaxID=2605943 RepID=UPI003CCBF2F0
MTDRTGPTKPSSRGICPTLRMAGLALAAALFLSGLASVPAVAQSFLAGFEDVPLMEGLTADEDAGLVFDSPAGRIVEAYAVGEVAWRDVITFYTATLKSLGWRTLDQGRFAREGEELHIDRFGRDGDLTIRFTLAPTE